MSLEDPKTVVKKYVEYFNSGNMEGLKSLFAEDMEVQGVFGKGTFEKIEPIWRQLIEGYGMQLKVDSMVAEGNTVACRYTETGIFKAPAFGNQPTGKSYELVAMEWFEIEAGKIKRRWGGQEILRLKLGNLAFCCNKTKSCGCRLTL